MKNAYVIVTDTHFTYRNKPNRHDYLMEIDYVKSKIDEIGISYLKRGYTPILIFLGDVYDNSYKDVTKALIEQDEMYKRKQNIFPRIFSVLGNHDLHFPKNNPFWTLVSNDSISVNNLPTARFKPLGDVGVLEVVDRINDGDVVFNFNHYSSDVLNPINDKINIGLFHQDIVCSPAISSAINKGLNPYQHSSIMLDDKDVLVGYDYSFFGHFHKYYGTWEIDSGRRIYYLGSLVRPNHEEVSDNYLERNIPTVLVEDGKFVGIEDNLFNLPSRLLSVIDVKVKEQQEKRKKTKERKLLLEHELFNESLVDSIKDTFNDAMYTEIIDSMIKREEDVYFATLKDGADYVK